MTDRNFVGLDYHMGSIQVSVMDRRGRELANRRGANDWHAVVQTAQRHGPVARAAIESCVGAANLAEQLVTQAGWSVDLAHPGYVARMKQTPDQTDRTDAAVLADLVRVGYLPKVWLAPRPIRQLRAVVRYRPQLVEEKRRVKLRIRAILREQRIKNTSQANPWRVAWRFWLEHQAPLDASGRWIVDRHVQRIEQLQDELKAVEQRLGQMTATDAVIERLRGQPGIGPVTAWVLRAEIGRFDRFASGKQRARFCGLSPRNASSGERVADAGLIKAGHPLLRTVLIEAAHRLARQQARWRDLAARLRAGGKPTVVVVAAVANRYVRWLYHQMQEVEVAAA
jgi:transposase